MAKFLTVTGFDLQGDLNLNICEAHAFNTKDNFSLDVFVVSGWTGQVSFATWPLCTESPTPLLKMNCTPAQTMLGNVNLAHRLVKHSVQHPANPRMKFLVAVLPQWAQV